MKQLRMVIGSAFLLIVLNGCMSYTKVNSQPIKDFRETVLTEHKEVKGLKVQYVPTQIQFIFELKSDVKQQEIKEVFKKTQAFIWSPSFEKEVIHESYFSKYSKEEKVYPNLSVSFDTNHDGTVDITFESSYYRDNVETGKKTVTEYKDWSFWDYKNDPVPVQD